LARSAAAIIIAHNHPSGDPSPSREAKENHVKPGWFSFNSEGGCEVCKGTGQISYDMAFTEPVVVVCEECGGHRYNSTALSYTYKGRNIEEVMSLTIEQTLDFFPVKKIRKLLQA